MMIFKNEDMMIHDRSREARVGKSNPKPMTPRDLAVLIHAGMRELGWERFDDGGTMANDQQPAILINTKDGRSFIVEVREP